MRRAVATQARSKVAIREITAAARTCFIADGYTAATIDGIAAKAERTKGAVYHHFADKQEIFRHVFIEEQRAIADQVIATGSSDDPVESLAGGLATYLEVLGTSPESAQLTLVQAPQVLGWEQWRTCDGGPFRALLTSSLLAIAQAQRLRSPIDAAVLAEFVLGAVTESAFCVAVAKDPPAVAARHAEAVRLFVNTLATPAGPGATRGSQ